MKYIKKKPHVIEAVQYNGCNHEEIIEFAKPHVDFAYKCTGETNISDGEIKNAVDLWVKPIGLSIEKPIRKGDYVIKDEAAGYGEISVCNQQLFENIYKEYKEDE